MKILIVEDEIIAASYLKQIVTKEGYQVVGVVGTGEGAVELAKSKKPDLILMDIMLKDHVSGVDAAVRINYLNPKIMIAFLTAYTESSMIETAKEANTVGYFLKPYNKEEIIANLHILASKETVKREECAERVNLYGYYSYHMKHQQLFFHDKEIQLTYKELSLIEYLCKNSHHVLSFEAIIKHLWEEETPNQTLRSLIYRIRQKTHPEFIISVNKRGYRISMPS